MQTTEPLPPLKKVLWLGAQRRCPCCGKGPIYKGWLKLHDNCSACGLKYLQDQGDLWAYLLVVDRALFIFPLIILIYCLVTALMTAGYLSTAQFVWMFSGLGFVIVCKAIVGTSLLARILAWRPLVGLGRISYSFYLLHSVALAGLFTVWWRLYIPLLGTAGNAVMLGIVGFVGAIGLGWMSFMLAERFYFKSREPVAMTAPAVDPAAQ